jgi:hypothetical protein
VSRAQGLHCDIGAYEYVPVAPTIAAFSPPTLAATGGALTITGAGFQTGTTVSLGGGGPIAPTTIAADGTALTVLLPAYTAGSIPFALTNPGNLTAATTIAYTPVIGSLGPTSGATTGGTTVTITGAGFAAGTTSVTFGTVAGTVVSVTPTQIRVIAPQHGVGAVDVTVTVNGQHATKAGAYTYGNVNPLPSQSPPGATSGGPPVPLPGPRATGAPAGAAPQPLPAHR